MSEPIALPSHDSPILAELIRGLPVRDVRGPLEVPVRSLVEDSRAALADSAFFACPGSRCHGSDYVDDAVSAGARVVFCEQPVAVPEQATRVRVSGLLRVRHAVASRFFGCPEEELTLFGVIGSRMRTRVSELAHFLLDQWNDPTGLINSERYDFGGEARPAKLATPEPCDLYRLLHEMAQCGRANVVMEISTHGLLRRRVRSLGFHVLVFTDHHFDPQVREQWGDVLPLKQEAFWQGWDRGRPDIAVINRDDPQADQLLACMPTAVDTVTYGINDRADIRAERIRPTVHGWRFDLCWEGGRVTACYPVEGPPARLLEALGALAVAYAFDRDLRQMAARLADWHEGGSSGRWLV